MTAVALPPPYRRVVAVAGLSNLADGIRMAAFPLLAYSLTSRATVIALVAVAGSAPGVLLGLWAGGVIDRVDRRRLLQGVTALRVVLLAGLAALILLDAVPLPLVAAAAFVLGVSEVLADNTTAVLVPILVPADQLERANSRMVGAQVVGNELAGPAIGGVLFAIGAAVPFLTNAGLLAAALLLLAGLPLLAGEIEPDSPNDHRPSIVDGLDFIRVTPLLRTVSWTSALLAAVDGAWFSLLVLFVGDELGYGPSGFGLFLAAGAIGGLGGVATADRWPNTSIVVVVLGVFVSMAVSLLALGLAPNVPVTAVALVVTSGGFALWNVYVVSARQRATPPAMYGRVQATYRTLVVGAALAGTMVGGLLADAVSLTTSLVACGAILACATPLAVAGFRRPDRRLAG